MTKLIKVASVIFEEEHLRGQPGAEDIVFKETEKKLDGLKGFGLNLVVLSEGIEAVGLKIWEAESVSSPGRYLNLYREFAVSERCHVAGSVKLKEGGKVFNSVAIISPEGKIQGAYHKANLTVGEIEAGLSPGRGAVVIDTEIGRIGGLICFDLNFRWLRDQYAALRPDILVFPSMYHGGFMQRIWAYECHSFFISALAFSGGGILDPLGTPLNLTDRYNRTAIAEINIDRAIVHLDFNWEKFPEIKRKYGNEIEIDIPPDIGSALIYSRSGKRTAIDIVREFGLEPLDKYFERALNINSDKRSPG
ncbi:MAG: carbon-nitrogen hydrolase family protein [Victivallales bacterium]|jgi:hypothetical protein